jgi:hypothetical protein
LNAYRQTVERRFDILKAKLQVSDIIMTRPKRSPTDSDMEEKKPNVKCHNDGASKHGGEEET